MVATLLFVVRRWQQPLGGGAVACGAAGRQGLRQLMVYGGETTVWNATLAATPPLQ